MATLYGLMAEFETAEEIVEASRKAYAEGFRQMEAYSPFPVEGLNDAIGYHRNDVALIVLIGGICGCVGGYLLQVWAMVWSYPMNIGGRPLNSWPAFIPVTFELTILCAGLSAVFGMLALNGLPMPYHPVFNVERFELASRSHFFLCIQGRDPKFETNRTRQYLQSLHPKGVYNVEP